MNTSRFGFLIALISFLLYGMSFAGCTSDQIWSSSYQAKVAEEREKAISQNDIFLDFKLGMTQSDYERQIAEQVGTNKIRPDIAFQDAYKFPTITSDTTGYLYFFTLPSAVLAAHLIPVFKADKLVQLILQVKVDLNKTQINQQLYEELVMLYADKYGHDFLERRHIYSSNDFYWLDANREVKLALDFSTITISYSDLNWKLSDTDRHDQLPHGTGPASPAVDDI